MNDTADTVELELERRDGVLRVSHGEWRRAKRADARIWVRSETTGELRATRQGVTLRPHEIADVIAALERCLDALAPSSETRP